MRRLGLVGIENGPDGDNRVFFIETEVKKDYNQLWYLSLKLLKNFRGIQRTRILGGYCGLRKYYLIFEESY